MKTVDICSLFDEDDIVIDNNSDEESLGNEL